MFLPDVGVDRGRLLTAQPAIGTLKPRLVSALVIHVAVLVPLQGEPAAAFLTLERLLLLAAVLQAPPLHAFPRLQTALPDHPRSFADQSLPERHR